MHLREGHHAGALQSRSCWADPAGQPKAWEVARAPHLAVRYKGGFKSAVTVRPALRRALGDHPAPDVIAGMTGKDTGFVLRYFVGLVAVKLGAKMKGFCVPVDEQ